MQRTAKTLTRLRGIAADLRFQNFPIYVKQSFSHNAAQIIVKWFPMSPRLDICFIQILCLSEPRCEKTGLRGFRPGPTKKPQKMARGLKFRGIVLYM